MKIAYQFSNLLGTVYHKGNLVFSVDGNSIVSPVGNRISIYDLKNNKSNTLPVESRFNYTAFDISPSGTTLIAVNDVGDGHIISLVSSSIIYKYNFKHPVSCLKFSPNGKFFAVGKGSSVMLFRTPGLFGKEFNPLTLEKTFKGFFDDVTCLDWSSDSRILIAGSKDATAKIFSLPKLDKFRLVSLGSHADSLVSVFFEEDSLDVTTISCNGRLCIWEANFELSALNTFKYTPPPNKIPKGGESDDEIDLAKGECTADNDENNIDDGKDEDTESLDDTKELLSYKQLSKHYLFHLLDDKTSKLASASYHKTSHILVVGFTKGTFLILELPSVNLVHSLSVSNSIISQLAFNKSGDWIAVGCEEQGQLVVWEWQSETYIMNQQGHSSNISSLAYSCDRQYIVTGGEDGKV